MENFQHKSVSALICEVRDDLTLLRDKLITLLYIKEDELRNDYMEGCIKELENLLNHTKNFRQKI